MGSFDRTVMFRLATSERLERAVKRAPRGEAAAWRAASRYVAGRTRGDALAAAAPLLEQGHGVSLDLFGEHVDDPAEADRVLDGYLALAAALPAVPADAWLSVDLSHLALEHRRAGRRRAAGGDRAEPARRPAGPGRRRGGWRSATP